MKKNNIKMIKKSLTDMMSGKPIVIDSKNFSLFYHVFNILGNDDFNRFFKHKPPVKPIKFFPFHSFFKAITS